MESFIFFRVGDHNIEAPGKAWASHGNLYRLIYLDLKDIPLAVENPEVEIDAQDLE